MTTDATSLVHYDLASSESLGVLAAVLLILALACLWAVWGLDVYMVKVSPHWGQREVVQAYYQDRKGPEEPLVAYQMNWKGENFYTSNHIPAFAHIDTKKTMAQFLRNARTHISCGIITLQVNMVQEAHQ